MVIRESFDPRPQNDESIFVSHEMYHEVVTGIPDAVRVQVDSCEDIEQVFNVYVLRCDPSCFSEVGLARIKVDRHTGELAFLCHAEK